MRYLWLLNREASTATRIRVKRLWRWRGDPGMRRGRYVQPGHITRVTFDFFGTERTISLWQDVDDWTLSGLPAPPGGYR